MASAFWLNRSQHQYESTVMGGASRRVTFLTPVKGRTPQKVIPVYFTSIKNRGLRKAVEYAVQVLWNVTKTLLIIISADRK